MELIKYDKQSRNGKDIWYEILENGFNIYIAQTQRPAYVQTEPYIPDPSKSYEENAKQMCADLSEKAHYVPTPEFKLTEDMYTEMQSNIDYLMLLNDPDSATEEET